MKYYIELCLWFGIGYFSVLFIRLYYYVYIKKEKKEVIMKEIKEHGAFFKSPS